MNLQSRLLYLFRKYDVDLSLNTERAIAIKCCVMLFCVLLYPAISWSKTVERKSDVPYRRSTRLQGIPLPLWLWGSLPFDIRFGVPKNSWKVLIKKGGQRVTMSCDHSSMITRQ